MSDGAAQMNVTPQKRSPWRNLSAAWLVPLLALIVSLGIAWQSFADRGTLITISFSNASGVIADETTLRFRDVVIGQVEEVTFTDDLTRVLVSVRVQNNVVPYLDEDAIFWVVRPEVSTRGISGLSTVLSGVYVEGAWDDAPGISLRDFVGADEPPLVQPGRGGKRITLQTDNGALIAYGAPVLYRGVEVGRLETPQLSADGETVLVDAFIEAPHDARLSTATRFWDTSGFEFSLGADGLSLDFDSIGSLLSGGIAFDNLYDGAEPISPGYVFTLYADEEEARRNRLVRGPGQGVAFTVLFDESVSGLEPGDEVTYQGVDVGEVTDLRSRIVDTPFGPELSLQVTVVIDPQRMGLDADATPDDVTSFFRSAISNGLRARLTTESLLAADLQVELAVLPDAGTAQMVEIEGVPPRIPSVDSAIPDFTATAEGVLERINALPIEEVMERAISLMASIEDLARSDDLQAAPGAAVALIEDTRALIAGEAIQGLPDELRAAVADARSVIGDLRDKGAVDALGNALTNLDLAMADLRAASQSAPDLVTQVKTLTESEIPALIADLQAVAQKADGLAIEPLLAQATETLERIDALLAGPDLQALPARAVALVDDTRALIANDALQGLPEDLRAAVADARNVISDLREDGAVDALSNALNNLDLAMADLRTASQSTPELMVQVQNLTETEIPALIADLQAVAQKADGLEVEPLLTQTSDMLARIDGLLAGPDVQALPGRAVALVDDTRALITDEAVQALPEDLRGAIADLRGVVADLRAQGAVETLGSALRNLDRSMADISIAAQDAPALTDNLRKLTENDVPALIADLQGVAKTAEDLDLQGLADSASDTLARIDAFMGSRDTQELPGTVNDALTEMRLALADLRQGGVVANLNATLSSARDAAEAVAGATEDLPDLTSRLEQLVGDTEAVVRAYGARSDFNQETLEALREVRNAARSVSELARAIERSPNSLIFGR